jgi:hypothetical protein
MAYASTATQNLLLRSTMQNMEYAVTPHKYELVCVDYKHRGGGPVKSSSSSSSVGLPSGMLGKQVGGVLTEAGTTAPLQQSMCYLASVQFRALLSLQQLKTVLRHVLCCTT